jgi:hypothetical protein
LKSLNRISTKGVFKFWVDIVICCDVDCVTPDTPLEILPTPHVGKQPLSFTRNAWLDVVNRPYEMPVDDVATAVNAVDTFYFV